jgi:hypothetical protein
VAGNEPALKLDFDQYQMDSRISFTRATNGTYFNSSGVLTTASANTARFDHRLENGVWVNKGLLIEEARTNLALRSEEFGDAAWYKDSGVTVSSNTDVAPDGTTTADTISFSAADKLIGQFSLVSNGTLASGSVYIKGTTGETIIFTVGGGSQSFTLTGDWQRISRTVTTLNTTSFALSTYGGVTARSIKVWGAQLEVGAFPTSYIATTSASVTRNQDVVSMTSTNFTNWFNSSEGTMFCLWDNVGFNAINNYIWQIDDTTANERYYLLTTSATAINDAIDNNTTQTPGFSLTYNPQLFQQYSNAFTYKVNDFAASFNGATAITDTSGSLPTVTRLVLGEAQTTATRPLNGHIAKFYYWPTRQPNTKLVSLTQ